MLEKQVAGTETWSSLDEVSTHLGISKDTIRGWIRKGTVPHYKVGRQYRFKLSEIDEWVTSGRSATADH